MSSVLDVRFCATRGVAASIAMGRTDRRNLDTRIIDLHYLRLARSAMEHHILVGIGRSNRSPPMDELYPSAAYPRRISIAEPANVRYWH